MNIYAQIFGTIAVLLMFTSYLKTSKKEYLFIMLIYIWNMAKKFKDNLLYRNICCNFVGNIQFNYRCICVNNRKYI